MPKSGLRPEFIRSNLRLNVKCRMKSTKNEQTSKSRDQSNISTRNPLKENNPQQEKKNSQQERKHSQQDRNNSQQERNNSQQERKNSRGQVRKNSQQKRKYSQVARKMYEKHQEECPFCVRDSGSATSSSSSQDSKNVDDDEHPPRTEAFCIGVCGGSSSGKTSVAERITTLLDVPSVTHVKMDDFYRPLTEKRHKLAERNEYNFDHPKAIDFKLLVKTVKRLKRGKRAKMPTYSFLTHKREAFEKLLCPSSVTIVEGIFTFYWKELRDCMDLKIFVDTDSDVRLARRLLRDCPRSRDGDGRRDVMRVLEQYVKHVKPGFDTFIAPTMIHADVILPRGMENTVAIDLIANQVRLHLQQERRVTDGSSGQDLIKQWSRDCPAIDNLLLYPLVKSRDLHNEVVQCVT